MAELTRPRDRAGRSRFGLWRPVCRSPRASPGLLDKRLSDLLAFITCSARCFRTLQSELSERHRACDAPAHFVPSGLRNEPHARATSVNAALASPRRRMVLEATTCALVERWL